MKRILRTSLLLALALMIGLAGCGDRAVDPPAGDPDEDPRFGGTIRIGYIADVNYLQPITDISAVDRMVNAWLHDSLIIIGADGSVQPRLAETWDVSEDNRTMVFYLRDDVTWHDGTAFTAHDVAFTVYTILNPGIRSNIRGRFSAVEGFEALTDSDNPARPEDLDTPPVEVIDDHTVQFNLAYSYAPFIPLALNYGLIPKHLLEEDIAAGKDIAELSYSADPVGLGPFKFVEWRRDERLVFERYDDYYQGRPFLERIVYEIIPDRTVISSELETGGIDFLWEAMPGAWDNLKSLDHIEYNISDGLGYSGVFLNTEDPVFSDSRIRQALRYALDMEIIVSEFLGEGMTLATGPVPPSLWAYDASLEPFPYDPDKAVELFAEAGWTLDDDNMMQKDGEGYAFTIETFDFARERQQASVGAQDHWAKIGLDVSTQWTETTVLLDRVSRGDYQASWVNRTGFIDPDGTLTQFETDQIDGGNTPRFSHEELDSILSSARRTSDQSERQALYSDALRILLDEQPVLWAGYLPNDFWYNKDFKGFVFTPESEGVFKNLNLVYIDR